MTAMKTTTEDMIKRQERWAQEARDDAQTLHEIAADPLQDAETRFQAHRARDGLRKLATDIEAATTRVKSALGNEKTGPLGGNGA